MAYHSEKAKRVPKVISQKNIEIVLSRLKRPRDKLIFLVGIYMGLRISEISRLCVEHLDFNDNTAFIALSKHKRERTVPIHESLAPLLREFIGNKKFGNIFLSRQNNPIHPRTVQLIFRAAFPEGRITPHMMRHQAATSMLNKTGNLRYVQEFLGHSSPNTTQIYTSVAIQNLNDAINKVPFQNVTLNDIHPLPNKNDVDTKQASHNMRYEI